MAPPRSQDKDDDAQRDEAWESSALLYLPSPNSTNRPSMTNLLEYGSLLPPDDDAIAAADEEERSIQMHINQGSILSFGDDEWPHHSQKRTKNKRDLYSLLLALAALLLLMTVGISILGNNHSNDIRPSEHNNDRTADDKTQEDSENNTSVPRKHDRFISRPLSLKDPVADLQVKSFQRPDFSSPNSDLFSSENDNKATPTNAWYQNLILARHEPTQEQRVYPVPFVMDVVGPIPGIRVHHPTVVAGATVVQLTQVLEHGLTLGASTKESILKSEEVFKKYTISNMTPLGITLEWSANASSDGSPLKYSSSIVRGMPYATMQYNSNQQRQTSEAKAAILKERDSDQIPLPTIASETPIGAPPVVDGQLKLDCESSEPQWVEKEIQLIFAEPDFTWLVFVSRPVQVQCIIPPPDKDPPPFVPGLPVPSPGVVFALQFLDDDDDEPQQQSSDLVIRVALANDCTYGANPITCGRERAQSAPQHKVDPTAYANLLRKHAAWYPGPDTDVSFDFVSKGSNTSEPGTTDATLLKFNWDVQSMGQVFDDNNNVSTLATSDDDQQQRRVLQKSNDDGDDAAKLLMYALPHHQDMIEASTAYFSSKSEQQQEHEENLESSFPTYHVDGASSDGEERKFCLSSLLGPVCLVQGSTWSLREDQSWKTSFRAPRPPQNESLPELVKAYKNDLDYELPPYYQRGAGDTYFSGKMLAKLGRILTIGEELHEICGDNNVHLKRPGSPKECKGLDVPSPSDTVFQQALARLRSGVEVWINGTADTPFVYDDKWGGMVSCGCSFDDSQGACINRFPDCPGFYDPGLNFGNAFYNDHHFHLGYHVYAAAVVAHFDPQWGRDHFEQVLLLIRDIANPSHNDTFFPTFRHKDWYQGSSWASGIAVSPLNGRNQESSSEAIASYEGIALYGMEMVKAWRGSDTKMMAVAEAVQNYGELLTQSEVRSADRYWHVIEASKRRQYPVQYTPHVVGIMWTTMAQFQTWFGSAAYLAYGIQLLPLTSAAEERDTIEWVRELYEPFSDSCDAHYEDCQAQGWSVLVLAMLATVGHHNDAIQKALELPPDAFTSAGGNGHSLTNTLWYIATRPHVDDPLVIEPSTDNNRDHTEAIEDEMHRQSNNPDNDVNGQPSNPSPPHPAIPIPTNFNCSCPETCNEQALNRFAVGHSCRDRIIWLMTERDHNEWEACHQVGLEFPGHCASCDPRKCSNEEVVHSETCPPCSKEVCRGELNLCPTESAPFLCAQGASIGGCSRSPWNMEDGNCLSCCELSIGCED